jgi:cell division protein FtsW
VVGIITQFGLQAVFNMCVALGLLPTKGMTLPLISYGGSSMIAMSFSLGILLAFTKRKIYAQKFKDNLW